MKWGGHTKMSRDGHACARMATGPRSSLHASRWIVIAQDLWFESCSKASARVAILHDGCSACLIIFVYLCPVPDGVLSDAYLDWLNTLYGFHFWRRPWTSLMLWVMTRYDAKVCIWTVWLKHLSFTLICCISMYKLLHIHSRAAMQWVFCD